MRADGTDVRRISSADKFAGSPKWSPDGQRIVFYEMEIQDRFYAREAAFGKLVDSQIVSVALANGIRQEHTSGPGLKVSPQFLSGNRIGYVMKGGRLSAELGARSNTMTGKPSVMPLVREELPTIRPVSRIPPTPA